MIFNVLCVVCTIARALGPTSHASNPFIVNRAAIISNVCPGLHKEMHPRWEEDDYLVRVSFQRQKQKTVRDEIRSDTHKQ